MRDKEIERSWIEKGRLRDKERVVIVLWRCDINYRKKVKDENERRSVSEWKEFVINL